MKFKEKSKLWILSYPFAHRNFTLVGDTLYHPPGRPPTSRIIEHESIHAQQMKETGTVKFILLYLFALPFIYNPWRYKWEMEAYIKGSKLTQDQAHSIVSSTTYGWLRNKCDN